MASVLVVKTPVAADKRIQVRMADYDERNPVPGRYRWMSEKFYALPELGKTPMDYVDFVSLETSPTIESQFLTARRNRAGWIVELPAESKPAAVQQFRITNPNFPDTVWAEPWNGTAATGPVVHVVKMFELRNSLALRIKHVARMAPLRITDYSTDPLAPQYSVPP